MSEDEPTSGPRDAPTASGLPETTPEWVKQNRGNIEQEAKSDGPHAWVFENIRRTYFEEGDS